MGNEIFCADLHQAPGAWASRPTIRGDSYYAFEQIVDYAIEHDARNIVAGGDNVDTAKPPAETVQFMREQVGRCRDEKVNFRFIQGQHDMSTPPWFAAVSGQHHAHQEVFTLGSIQCYGLDYLPAAQLAEALQEIPRQTELLVCHQVWSDFMGSIAVCEGALSDIPHVKYVLTGDYHKFVDMKTTNRQGKECRVWSPGSTCMQSIDEDPDKYCLLFDNKNCSIRKLPLRTRPMIEWHTLDEEDELQSFLDNIGDELDKAYDAGQGMPENIRKPLLYVEYSLDLEKPYSRILKAIDNRAHFFHKQVVPVSEQHVIEKKQRREVAKKGLVGCLPLVIPDVKSPVYRGLERLLSSPDPKAELQRLREEALGG